jgi:hypothetical protein
MAQVEVEAAAQETLQPSIELAVAVAVAEHVLKCLFRLKICLHFFM